MSPGPAPKDPRQRRRANPPAAGEWVDLPELTKPVLPPLPRRTKKEGPWSPRTRAMWEAWRRDPATSQFSSGDISYAVETAYLVEDFQRTRKVTLASEIRLRMDGLGLTAKGRRNLRWRFKAEGQDGEVIPIAAGRARRRLRDRVAATDPSADPDPRIRLSAKAPTS